MPTITVSSSTADRLGLIARAWSVTPDTAVARLLDNFMTDPDGTSAPATDAVRVHALYGGERIEGEYHVASSRLDITAGPCAGRSFKTPSGAAIAVVQARNPRVNPNRNDWSFWIVTDTGETLQSRRPKR